MKKLFLLFSILGVISCADPPEGAQVQLVYTTPDDCRRDLYPDYAPDNYYDKIEDLCGAENKVEGPDPY